MTKEEIEKEAEEYANNLLFVYETDIVQRIVRERVRLALIYVLESREKQIQIDAEQIRALQKQKGELTDKVAGLKKQLGNLYEIIKRPYQFTASRKIQTVKEAEQFLKEI